jgi:hypothetical protein
LCSFCPRISWPAFTWSLGWAWWTNSMASAPPSSRVDTLRTSCTRFLWLSSMNRKSEFCCDGNSYIANAGES